MKFTGFLLMAAMFGTAATSHASPTQSFACTGGATMIIDYTDFGGGMKSANELILHGTADDGTYTPMGDGFGFESKGTPRKILFLDAGLYDGKDAGKVTIPNQATLACTAN